LTDFDVPLRRKFPISQPSILKHLQRYNWPLSYDYRLKPFGFVQSVVVEVMTGQNDLLVIAPFESDLAKSKRLPWVDFKTGKRVTLDWNGQHFSESVSVMRLSKYVEDYGNHAEAKAADCPRKSGRERNDWSTWAASSAIE
jgi:hypothetical protein